MKGWVFLAPAHMRGGLGQVGGRGFLVTTYLDPRIPSGLQGERLRGN